MGRQTKQQKAAARQGMASWDCPQVVFLTWQQAAAQTWRDSKRKRRVKAEYAGDVVTDCELVVKILQPRLVAARARGDQDEMSLADEAMRRCFRDIFRRRDCNPVPSDAALDQLRASIIRRLATTAATRAAEA